MLTLTKAEKHENFDDNVKMIEKIIKMTQSDFSKRKIVKCDSFREKSVLGIRISNLEVWYDKEESTYTVLKEQNHPGTYWQPPETELETVGFCTTFPKALELVMHTLVTENISAFMEAESEEFFVNLPQVEWRPNDFNSSIPKGVLKHPSCNRQAQL